MSRFVHLLSAASRCAAVPHRKAPPSASDNFRTDAPFQHLDLSTIANFSFALNKNGSASQPKNRHTVPTEISGAIRLFNHLICRELANFPFVLAKTNQGNSALPSGPALPPPPGRRCSSEQALSRLATPTVPAYPPAFLRPDRRSNVAPLTPSPTISNPFISTSHASFSFDVTKSNQSKDIANSFHLSRFPSPSF